MSSNIDPLATLIAWRDAARASGLAEPDAMVLATATPDGVPSARVVLLRGIDAEGGLRFFTHYESRKAGELDGNPHAAAVFLWAELGRQVRVEGAVARLTAEESDAYFVTRPREHQLSAWASPQSRPIASLDDVLLRRAGFEQAYAGGPVPRPPFWGGYRLLARQVELWQRGEHRLHDRRVFERDGGAWRERRLAP